MSANFLPDGRHPGSQETYDHVATWIDTKFPFSKKDGWGRFGMLGVLGDMILTSLPGAHILEIGTGESSIYLTQLARLHNRRIFYCDEARGKITNPMTISGYLHEDIALTERYPEPASYRHKQAVAYVGTSDDFFKNIELPPIGLAFIDGEHHSEFVRRDVDNTLRHLVNDGYIFCHDMYPYEEGLVLGDYCADAYRVRQELERRLDLDVFTFSKMVACNVGLTMIRKKPGSRPYYQE